MPIAYGGTSGLRGNGGTVAFGDFEIMHNNLDMSLTLRAKLDSKRSFPTCTPTCSNIPQNPLRVQLCCQGITSTRLSSSENKRGQR